MKAIDTKSWAEFKVGDLFEIENGKYVDPKTLTSDDNGSPYLTASIFNNGQNTDKYTGEGFKTKPNIISWGKQSPLFSYHTEACYTGQGIYWFEFDKGQNVAHFICTVLQNVGKNYNYQNCLTGAKLKQETIKLPIDQTGQPDWDYMEAFMEGINQQAQARLNEYKEGKLEYTTLDTIGYTPVDTESWAEFKVEKLFELLKTTRKVTKLNFSPEGKIPAYSSDTRNNGILGYIEGEPEYLVDDMNKTFLIFGDHTRSMNIAHESFSVMDNVKVLKPKLEMSDEQLLFIITVWKNSIPNLGYSRHWNVAKNTNISLPVQPTIDPDKTYHPEGYIPDWDYMEAFMKQINQQAQAKLDTLEKGNI